MRASSTEASSFNTLREIAADDVARHNSSDDAWIIIKGTVYDVTKFVPTHPGGKEILLPILGRDATDEFEAIGHSKDAVQLLQSMAIGRVACCNDAKMTTAAESRDVSASSLNQFNHPDREITRRRKAEENRDSSIQRNSMLDLNKALLPQVYRLSLSDYAKFTQEIHTMKSSCQLFPNDLLEKLSRTHWAVIPLVWLPIACYSAYLGVSDFELYRLPLLAFPLLWLFGVLFWTFFEYIFHRFVFHYAEGHLPNNGAVIAVHFTIHQIHHIFPLDQLRLVMPPILFFILCTPIYILSSRILCIPSPILYSLWSGQCVLHIERDTECVSCVCVSVY